MQRVCNVQGRLTLLCLTFFSNALKDHFYTNSHSFQMSCVLVCDTVRSNRQYVSTTFENTSALKCLCMISFSTFFSHSCFTNKKKWEHTFFYQNHHATLRVRLHSYIHIDTTPENATKKVCLARIFILQTCWSPIALCVYWSTLCLFEKKECKIDKKSLELSLFN